MWSKAVAVRNAAAQRRVVHGRRRCAAGASSTCSWPAGREALGHCLRRRSCAAVSDFNRPCIRCSQATQNHFLRSLGAPRLDTALQGCQLCLAGIRVRNQGCQPFHQSVGRDCRLGDQPALDHRPRIGERIHPSFPPVLGRGLFAMRWPCFPILLRRRQADDEVRDGGCAQPLLRHPCRGPPCRSASAEPAGSLATTARGPGS